MGWYEIIDSDKKKLDAIQRQHVSDEACLKALLEAFLLGKGPYQPSWRRVIHALHEAGESHLAEKIKASAEPVQGECVWMLCNVGQQYMHNSYCHMTSFSYSEIFPSACA